MAKRKIAGDEFPIVVTKGEWLALSDQRSCAGILIFCCLLELKWAIRLARLVVC